MRKPIWLFPSFSGSIPQMPPAAPVFATPLALPLAERLRKASSAMAGFLSILTFFQPATAFSQKPRESPLSAGSGSLMSLRPDGQMGAPCPLKHTDVKASISGPLARVVVEQQFQNPFQDKIEAVYTFPLPSDAAVDEMTMQIGDRIVRGKIKPKDEARAIYNAARQSGHLAGLLDQERPNIFTQAIANIQPGESVKIIIKYVETLKYEDGNYRFTFPMVVGPRYTPAGTPNAANLNPPVTPNGTRAGHDISLTVSLDAGVPVNFLRSLTHDIEIQKTAASKAFIHLKNRAELPNKDFILEYDVSGAKIADAILTHRGSKGGFFSMILQPPDKAASVEITPKELVFVLDTSGSMMGFPIDKAKETMKLALEGLHPRDTFNLITFSGDTSILFPAPVPATPENLAKAQEFLRSRRGSGGTEMMKAIRAALDPSDRQDHIRVVCFMTDGYVGNDLEIIGEMQKHPNARVFSFGIGSSVNHFLLDQMAREGRGEVEYVALEDDGSAAARRFYERVRTPLLTDLRLEWNGVQVSDVYPARLPDLFSAKPLVVAGRYDTPGKGVLRLHGKQAGRDFVREIPVMLPASEPEHDVVATLWARRKVDALMASNWNGMQSNDPGEQLKSAITKLGVNYGLMTQFTSFVAVEETIRTEGGVPRRVEVPVEMPAGVSYEGIFGNERKEAVAAMAPSRGFGGFVGFTNRGAPMAFPAPPSSYPEPAGQASQDSAVIANRPPTQVASADTHKVDASLRKVDPALLTGRASASRGRITVKLWLDDTSDHALADLQAAGFTASGPLAGKFITGSVEAGKLTELAKLSCVRYISQP